MEEKEYSVSEAVRLIGVESHVLRYWEEELQLEIGRSSQGHRIYNEENVATFRQVKRLKDNGIQLKAIRVLLEEKATVESGTGKDRHDFLEQIQLIEKKSDEEKYSMLEDERDLDCEVLLPETQPDHLKQFEVILKKMVSEVVEEQNEKMKQAIAQMLKEEIEELYLQYYHLPMEEAAVSLEGKKKRTIAELLRRICRMK